MYRYRYRRYFFSKVSVPISLLLLKYRVPSSVGKNQGFLTGGKFTIYPLGVNFAYRGGKFSELKTKENFSFHYRKSSSGTLGVNCTFFFRQEVNETKKVKNPWYRCYAAKERGHCPVVGQFAVDTIGFPFDSEPHKTFGSSRGFQ